MSEETTPAAKTYLIPFGEQLVLKELPPIERIGTIIVPEAHQRTLNQGKVLDKGPMCSADIKEGDIVFFTMHSDHRLKWEGIQLIIVAESACLGKITKDKPAETPEPTNG